MPGKLVSGQWQPTWDEYSYGEREKLTLWLWTQVSACHGIIDDRCRVAKINSSTDNVVDVWAIDGYDCDCSVRDGSPVVFRNTANNIAYMALGKGKLYVVSEQNILTLIQWVKQGKKTVTTFTMIKTLTFP